MTEFTLTDAARDMALIRDLNGVLNVDDVSSSASTLRVETERRTC